jgi:hypothetical protein
MTCSYPRRCMAHQNRRRCHAHAWHNAHRALTASRRRLRSALLVAGLIVVIAQMGYAFCRKTVGKPGTATTAIGV